jgi:hypothetical protein
VTGELSEIQSRRPNLAGDLADGAGHLGGLKLDPLARALRLRPPSFGAEEQPRVHEPVRDRLESKRAPSGAPFDRKELSSFVQAIQVLADHTAIDERRAVLEDEHRDLAEGGLRQKLRRRRSDVGDHELDSVDKPNLAGHDENLAGERGRRGPPQDHRRRGYSLRTSLR